MSDKIIFFNWEKVYKHCNYDLYKLVATFRRGEHLKYPGYSFILNPKPLLSLSTLYDPEIAQYIFVASQRNYFDAKHRHNTRLLTLFLRDVDIDISKNRLLKTVGNEILFKYEENYYGN